MNVRQVLVFRRDLQVRRGKLLAQAGHGSMAFLTRQFMEAMSGRWYVPATAPLEVNLMLSVEQQEWVRGLFTKIALVVDTEQELQDLHKKVIEAGLTSHLIVDAGLTEFAGVPTLTCVAIGPHDKERIDPLTSHLNLY